MSAQPPPPNGEKPGRIPDAWLPEVTPGHPDAPLIALCDGWERLIADKGDDATEEGHARLDALEKRILDTPSETTAGMFSKLRLVNAIWGDEPERPERCEGTDRRLIRSALADARGLPGWYGGRP